MKTKIVISILLVAAITSAVYLLSNKQEIPFNPQNKTVYISKKKVGYQLIRNGKPYLIKGVSGKGQNYSLLQKIGANSIRIYDVDNLGEILDSAEHYGLSVMVGLPIPKSKWIKEFYSNPNNTDKLIEKFNATIDEHKDHPALLAWCLGNELDFPYKPHYTPFYESFNKLLSLIKEKDPNHPVTTSLMNFHKRTITNIKLKIPELDFISINTFGILDQLEEQINSYNIIWDGPILLTEWGVSGYWEQERNTAWGVPFENSSSKKIEKCIYYYNYAMPKDNPNFIGSYFFHWGYKMEYTSSWFSTFTKEGKPKEIIYALNYLWNGSLKSENKIPLDYLLINNEGFGSDLLLKSSSKNTANIIYNKPISDSLDIKCTIMNEDWFSLRIDTTPLILAYDETIKVIDNSTINFNAPKNQGPYRLFVQITNKGSYVSSANIPFYVIE